MSRSNNGISEWFGHQVYPDVAANNEARADQVAERCPFLSDATGLETSCVKSPNSKGVCTISSTSNGPRQDWLVCPFRALSDSMLEEVVSEMFGAVPGDPSRRLVIPGPRLAEEDVRREVVNSVNSGFPPVVYFQNKLGGEISIPKTDKSPEFSLDITLAEIDRLGSSMSVSRYGIWEVQTMDFHGSYRHAVKNLKAALRLHPEAFHEQVERNQNWPSDRIEGPNKSNVFKRTFYQMAFKFEIASRADCAGCVLSLPEAVWDSWQPHLGKPPLQHLGRNSYALVRDDEYELDPNAPTCIYIFEPDSSSRESPRPLRITKKIFTDTTSFAHFALRVAPEAAVGAGGAASAITERLLDRIRTHWPDFGGLPLVLPK